MHPSLRGWTCCAFAGLLSLAVAAPLTVQVRLLTPVSTYYSKPGAEISAEVVSSAGQVPKGATLRGEVVRVKKVGLGLVHESATLLLKFSELDLADGSWYAVESRVVNVDNARERVDRKGAIHGLRATDSLSHRFGTRIAFGMVGHPFFMIPAVALESGLFRFPDPEIDYRVGTELDLRIELPNLPREEATAVAEETAGLQETIDGLPYWSYSKRQRQSMDLVNLAFVGTREQVERAFTAAGWSGARPNSMMGGLRAIRAVVEARPYGEAPMRTLLLDGEEPDMRWQKTLNTFEKRHHLRVWKRAEEWNGRTIWAAAATQDIATTFSMRPFGFTHEIEKDVDRERDKVVGDLVFAGCVDQVVEVRRPEPVRESADYRKGVNSDSRVAVVLLNSCAEPQRDLSATVADPQPGQVVRFTRRVILTTKNHFIRDNIVWRSGEVARLGVETVRRWYIERKKDRLASAGLTQVAQAGAR